MFRSQAGFPYPFPGDPEWVFKNAAFLALAEPGNRKILELLRIKPMCAAELTRFVEWTEWAVFNGLQDLVATGFVTVSGDGEDQVFTLDRRGFGQISGWIAEFGA